MTEIGVHLYNLWWRIPEVHYVLLESMPGFIFFFRSPKYCISLFISVAVDGKGRNFIFVSFLPLIMLEKCLRYMHIFYLIYISFKIATLGVVCNGGNYKIHYEGTKQSVQKNKQDKWWNVFPRLNLGNPQFGLTDLQFPNIPEKTRPEICASIIGWPSFSVIFECKLKVNLNFFNVSFVYHCVWIGQV